jgi:hypothetical protein
MWENREIGASVKSSLLRLSNSPKISLRRSSAAKLFTTLRLPELLLRDPEPSEPQTEERLTGQADAEQDNE